MAITDYRQMTDAGTLRKQPQGWSGGVQPPRICERGNGGAQTQREMGTGTAERHAH